MSPNLILADVSELAQKPLRTGIQRVVRAVLRHWPGPQPLLPCRFDATCGGLVPLPPRAVDLLTEADPAARGLSGEEVGERVGEAVAKGPRKPLCLNRYRPILIPELFFDPARSHFYRELLKADPGAAAFIAYDFIPWLQPDALGVDRTHHVMPYLTTLSLARRIAFISKATRDAFGLRILRRGSFDGPVLPLGSDGLAENAGEQPSPRQRFRPERDLFVAIGSIDGRKHQDQIAKAFLELRATGVRARLAVVGGIFEHDRAKMQARAVRAAAETDPEGIRYLPNATDAAIGALLAEARATIYLSEAEGFGLPPLEGLALGIPTIVGGDVHSVYELSPAGHIRLTAPTAEALVEVVRRLMNNQEAARLWEEASSLSLPTWRGFAEATAAWMQAHVP